MSWKPEVIADSSGKWAGNALRFATYDEAYRNACHLMMRWTLVSDWRASESEDPVNYRYSEAGELIPVEEKEVNPN